MQKIRNIAIIAHVDHGKDAKGPATALDAAEGTDSSAAASAPRKFFRNGILLIERNGKVYTSQGAEL